MPPPAVITGDLIVHKPAFLYAGWVNETDLAVYRSPLVKPSDSMYGVINSLLNQNPYTIIHDDVLKDRDMMLGKGHLTVYRFVL